MDQKPKTLFNVVLIEPEIPNNTGNIGRTCVGFWSRLHLVGPLGFSIDDKAVKRSGLDYWPHLDLVYHKSKQDWSKSIASEQEAPCSQKRVHLIETGSSRTIFDIEFREGDYLVFGRETTGIPRDIISQYSEHVYSIPFPGKLRSFNLSNCVAMVMCEGVRQLRNTQSF